MARPASELTQRELEVMHLFWQHGELSAMEARELLVGEGHGLTYVTVANLVRGIADKGLLRQVNQQRPFRYRPTSTFQEVSRRLLGDLLHKVFRGSREELLVQLLDRRRLTKQERARLQQVLDKLEDPDDE